MFFEYYNQKISNLSPFNRRAFEICKGYIANNEFSLFLENRETTIDDWKEKLKEIENLQEDLKIKNYFPYYRSIEFLEREITLHFSQSELNFDLLDQLISHYQSMIVEFNKKLDWCEERSFLAFQLPFEECLVDFSVTEYDTAKETSLKGFLASSFVLPINYLKLQNDLALYNSNLLKYNTMLEIQKNIRRDKDEIKDLRKTMDNTDKRSIEILSIFSAIVLFVAGDIQLFTKISNARDAVSFMFFFGYILGSFVLLIWFITRADGFRFRPFSKLHIFIILLFLSGAIFGFGMLRGWFNSDESNQQAREIEQLKYKIDSLEKRNQIIKLENQIPKDTTAK